MPSIGSILSVATTALRSQQEAITVTAHNIANAATEGYSRQRPVLSSMPPLRTPTGVFGTGVKLADIQRVRDAYLDTSYRNELGEFKEQEYRSGVLGQVETLLAEPGEGGLGKALDQFFSAWSSLAANPTSATARGVVRDQADFLAGRMRDTSNALDNLRQDTESRLLTSVQRVNELAQGIARINREVTASESSGETAGDLRDTRDRAIDELSTLIPVQVTQRANGSVGVMFSGFSLVDGAHSSTLEVRLSGSTVGVGLAGHPSMITDMGGGIGGMLRVLNTDLPEVTAKLDELAEALVTEVNALHRTGTNPAGLTGVDFFDPAATTASSIGLSAAVAAGVDAISAGTGGPAGEYRAGANGVANSLASLRDTASGLLGSSYGEHFRRLVSDVGFGVRSSLDLVEVHETLAGQADVRRSSLSGVSTDEELVRLIEFQTAYAAAARVVTTANEMLETLVRM